MLAITQDYSSADKNGSGRVFDLSTLPARKQREIEAFVKKCILQTKSPPQKRV
jgi:hypothetical protein